MYQALSQLDFQGLAEPALRHIEDQQNAGDQPKNAQLIEELRKIAMRQCIIERLIPIIEANLAVGRGSDDEKQDLPITTPICCVPARPRGLAPSCRAAAPGARRQPPPPRLPGTLSAPARLYSFVSLEYLVSPLSITLRMPGEQLK